MADIQKVAVIGAGVMGAGIAAHLANAGCPVVLLDIPAEGSDRSSRSRAAVAMQAKVGGFMHPDQMGFVSVGNTEDDLESLADVDWVIEAIIENVELKRALYARLDTILKPNALLSSNTSTIPLAHLVEGLPAARASRVLITHFFNPPRYMRLLEVVGGPNTAPDALRLVSDFADHRLGKSVVPCKDTPGFLANRIGCLWMLTAVRYALELGLTVEDADAVIGKPFGIPATGIFGLTDLVGIDLMPKVWASFADTLPANDRFHSEYVPLPAIAALVERGTIGRKAKAGFYRKGAAGMEAVDWASLDYRPVQAASLESARARSARAVMEHPDQGGRYAWAVMARTLVYAIELVPEISDSLAAVDEAMRLGYNWRMGPFELIDSLGVEWFAAALADHGFDIPALLTHAVAKGGFYGQANGQKTVLSPAGAPVALTPPVGVITIADLRLRGEPIQGNEAASLWDMGDGVACLEFHRKMNAVAPQTLTALNAALARVQSDFKALVIGNDAAAFSAGADLTQFLAALETQDFAFLEDFITQGQTTYNALLAAPFPVVGAVAGLALGGGCEVLLHCDAIQAHAETAMGLVERNVGLIPAWGGCRRLLARNFQNPKRAKGPVPAALSTFETIIGATVSGSALWAQDIGFLRPGLDGITMNRARLLADAKARALSLCPNYQPTASLEMRLAGVSGAHTLMNFAEGQVPLGRLKGHDLTIAALLARVLSGGDADVTRPLSEQDINRLEREAFLELCRSPLTQERIRHMLATGKPLRN